MGCGCGKSFSKPAAVANSRVSVTSQSIQQAQQGNGSRVVQSQGVTLGQQPVRSSVVRRQV